MKIWLSSRRTQGPVLVQGLLQRQLGLRPRTEPLNTTQRGQAYLKDVVINIDVDVDIEIDMDVDIDIHIDLDRNIDNYRYRCSRRYKYK